ncbi:ester cyclase [Betaproteobacteria bacterium]|nr:ester cyclase [Betaproteobacteria bacterium]
MRHSLSHTLVMTKSELIRSYRDYIACLNQRDWNALGRFVHENVKRNGEPLGLSGYRKMLEKDVSEIPDLSFKIELLIADPPYMASRLRFDCTPKERFLNLSVLGRQISFAENVFYEFLDLKIAQVWSIIDKAAIEAQLRHY